MGEESKNGTGRVLRHNPLNRKGLGSKEDAMIRNSLPENSVFTAQEFDLAGELVTKESSEKRDDIDLHV